MIWRAHVRLQRQGSGAQERAHPNFVTEDLRRRPRDPSLVLVDTVDEEGSTATDVVDRVLDDRLDTGALSDDVEAVRVLLLELGPLGGSIPTLEVPVLIGGLDLTSDVHLDAFVGGNNDTRGSVDLQELSKEETRGENISCLRGLSTKPRTPDSPSGSRADEEHRLADLDLKLVEAVDGARSGLEKRRLSVGELVDLVELRLLVRDVLSEASVHGNTLGTERLAEK